MREHKLITSLCFFRGGGVIFCVQAKDVLKNSFLQVMAGNGLKQDARVEQCQAQGKYDILSSIPKELRKIRKWITISKLCVITLF